MQFEKCLTCPSIKEKRCTGPKFMRASAKDVVEWLFAYMKLNGITNAQLAERSGIPKGTIDGLKNRADVRHETFYPLLKAVIEMTGGVWDAEACPMDSIDEKEVDKLVHELEHTKEMLAHSTRVIRERTIALACMFGLSAGLVILLMLMSL